MKSINVLLLGQVSPRFPLHRSSIPRVGDLPHQQTASRPRLLASSSAPPHLFLTSCIPLLHPPPSFSRPPSFSLQCSLPVYCDRRPATSIAASTFSHPPEPLRHLQKHKYPTQCHPWMGSKTCQPFLLRKIGSSISVISFPHPP